MSKRWGLPAQGVALAAVAALVATLVVIGRTPDASPSAPAQPVQVGLSARAVIEVRTPAPPPDPQPAPTLAEATTTVPVATTTTIESASTTSLPATSSTSPGRATTTTTTTPTTTTTVPPPPCTPPAPILLSPSDNQVFIGPSPSITLAWSGWRGSPPACLASGFYAEVATDTSFGNVVASIHLASGGEWTPSGSTWSCSSSYYWRVTSKRSDGTLATSSNTWKLNVTCVS